MYTCIFHVTRKLPTYIELAQLKFTIRLVKYLFMVSSTEKHFMIQLHLFIASNQLATQLKHLSHQFLVYAILWNGTEPTQNIPQDAKTRNDHSLNYNMHNGRFMEGLGYCIAPSLHQLTVHSIIQRFLHYWVQPPQINPDQP